MAFGVGDVPITKAMLRIVVVLIGISKSCRQGVRVNVGKYELIRPMIGVGIKGDPVSSPQNIKIYKCIVMRRMIVSASKWHGRFAHLAETGAAAQFPNVYNIFG